MNVVVVGALGLIGSEVVSSLAERGHAVHAVDSQVVPIWKSGWKLKAEAMRIERVNKNSLSLTLLDPGKSPEEFEKILIDNQIDVLINVGGNSLAAEFSDRRALWAETMSQLNKVCAVLAEGLGVRYVYISSSMVYGDFLSSEQSEDSVTSPRDPYGALKLGCEHLIKAVGEQNKDFDYAILRPSAVYGALDTNERVLTKFLHLCHNKQPLYVRDLKEGLDFTFVEDVAEMISLAAEYGQPIRDTFNVTNGRAETFETIIEFLRWHFDVALAAHEDSKDILRPKRGTLSMSKFDSRFGPHPSRSVTEGMAAMLRFSREANLLGCV